jgi:hypothetical protein
MSTFFMCFHLNTNIRKMTRTTYENNNHSPNMRTISYVVFVQQITVRLGTAQIKVIKII